MNNNATNSLLAGSSVNFSLNHSQLVVSNKSLGNGSDVRITWYNSSSASEVELDRVLEPNGLVGLWHFDDGSGQTLTDSSGNNNDGVITESTWNSSGRAGGSALSFDGVNDMVTISSLQNTDFPQTAGTIAFWVKGEYEGQDAKSLFDDYDGSRNHIFMRVRNTSSLLYFQVQWMNTTPAYIAGASIYVENDEWVFVTLTYNTSSDSAKTYINGTLRDSDTMTDTSWVPDGQFVRLAGAINFFNGSMDEMAIYNRDLSDVEVNALYQAGLKGHGVSKGFALENSTLWFKTKADISASSNDSNYYVYYNNSGADSAPVNTSAVFQKIDLSDELDNGLVSFWHMDEGSGQFLNDSGSGNNNGTLGANSGSASDDPAWQNENSSIDGLQTNFSSGSQLHFDGSNDYVLVQDNPVFHWEDGEVTAAMWIKPRNLSTTPIFFTKTDYNSGYWNGFDIRLQSSKVRVVTNATSDRDVWGTTVLEENTWYHVAVTIDNTNAKIYLNGNEDATESTVAYNLTNTLNLYIGSYNSPDYFLNGSIDEVALWNRSLSASEIKALYERRKHLVPLWTSSLGIETDNDSPSFSFVSPSDSDGAGVSRNYSYVNVSTTDVSLTSAFIDWNKSLVGYWGMDWYNSTGIYGNSTYAYNGTFNGNLSTSNITDGKFGNALKFDGDTDYVNLPSVNPTEAISVEAWVKSADSTGYSGAWQIVSKYSAYILGTGTSAGSNMCFIIFNGTAWVDYGNCFTVPDPQNWHHFVGTYDSSISQQKLYVDGVLRQTKTATGTINPDTGSVNIGKRESSTDPVDYFNGSIDEVRIWNRVLTAEEVNASFNSSLYRLERNFTGLADGNYDYYAFAIDAPGNSNQSSSRTLTVDSVNPASFSFASGTEADNANLSQDYFYVNVTFTESNPDSCLLEVGGSNVSMTRSGSNCFVNRTSQSDATYAYKVYANDSANNWGASASRSVTLDTVNPFLSFVSPTDSDGGGVGRNYSYVNVTVTDGANTSAFIDWNKSLVGYWAMDWYNSTGVFDNSTYGNNGTFNGGLETGNVTNGMFGKALDFDGFNDYVKGDASFNNDNTGSLDFWVKANEWTDTYGANESQQMLTLYNSGIYYQNSAKGIWVYNEYNRTYARFIDGTNSLNIAGTVDTSYWLGNWRHIAVTWNNGVFKFYDDGVLKQTVTNSSLNLSFNVSVYAGFRYSAYPFNGSIDEVRVWSRVLSAEEINASFNNGLYRLNQNFTGLADGNYSYYAFAVDYAGNVNQSSSRTLTVDSGSPSLSFVSPTESDNAFVARNYFAVNATVSDANLGLCVVELDGSNITVAPNGNDYCLYNATGQSDAAHTYTMYANDSAGNWGGTAQRAVTVDTTIPNTIAFVSPTDSNNSFVSRNYYYVNVTFAESNPDSCLLQVGGANISMTRSGSNCYLNRTSQSDGNYSYQVYVNDSAGNWNSSLNQTILLDAANPSLSYVSPTESDNAWISRDYFVVNATVSDANPDLCVSEVDGSNTSIASTGDSYCTQNLTSQSEGAHTYTMYLNDSAGNWGGEGQRTVYVDTVLPAAFAYVSPTDANNSFNNRNYYFVNVTFTELNPGACLLEVGGSNVSMTLQGTSYCFVNRTGQSDGSYSYRVYLNDSANNWNASFNQTVVLDTSIPQVSVVAPSPANNSYQTAGYAFINASYSETNPASCVLSWNGVNESATVSGGTCNLNKTSLADGNYSFVMYLNDSAGLVNASLNRTFTVDAAAPASFSFASGTEADNANLSQDYFYVNVTFTESNPDSCLLEVGGSNVSMTRSGSNCFVNRTSQSDATYAYKVYANDSANNWGASASRSVTLDTVAPLFSGLATNVSSPATFDAGTVQFNATWTDASTSVSSVVFEFDGVNSSVSTSSGNEYYSSKTGLAVGNYSYRWYANDSANNWNASSLQNFSVVMAASAPLSLYLNGSESNLSVLFGVASNASANSTVGNLTLYLNGSVVSSPHVAVLGVGFWNYTATSSGNENYSASSVSRFVEVNKSALSLLLNVSPSGVVANGSQTNVSCSSNVSEVTPLLYRNGSNVSDPDVQILSPGTYEYVCNSTQTQNYSAQSASSNLTVRAVNLSLTKSLSVVGAVSPAVSSSVVFARDESGSFNSNVTVTLNASDFLNGSALAVNLTINILRPDGGLLYQTNGEDSDGFYQNTYALSGSAPSDSGNYSIVANVSDSQGLLSANASDVVEVSFWVAQVDYNTTDVYVRGQSVPFNVSVWYNGSLANASSLNVRFLDNNYAHVANKSLDDVSFLSDGAYNGSFSTLSLSSGAYLLYVNVNGSVLAEDKHADVTLQADSSSPSYSNLSSSVASGSGYSALSYQFNASWSDNALVDFVILEFDGVNFSASGNEGSEYFVDFPSFGVGNYSYRWFANDSSGNWNVSGQQTFSVVKASAPLSLYLNGSESDLTGTTNVVVNASANSSLAGVVLFLNGVSVSNPNLSLLGVGTWNYTATVEGNANYSDNSITRFVFVSSPLRGGVHGRDVVISSGESSVVPSVSPAPSPFESITSSEKDQGLAVRIDSPELVTPVPTPVVRVVEEPARVLESVVDDMLVSIAVKRRIEVVEPLPSVSVEEESVVSGAEVNVTNVSVLVSNKGQSVEGVLVRETLPSSIPFKGGDPKDYPEIEWSLLPVWIEKGSAVAVWEVNLAQGEWVFLNYSVKSVFSQQELEDLEDTRVSVAKLVVVSPGVTGVPLNREEFVDLVGAETPVQLDYRALFSMFVLIVAAVLVLSILLKKEKMHAAVSFLTGSGVKKKRGRSKEGV